MQIKTLTNNTITCGINLNTIKVFVLIAITTFNLSCNDNKVDVMQEKQVDKNVLYGIPNIQFPNYTKAASYQLLNWGVYSDFINEVKSINGSKYDALKVKTERLVTYVDSMTKVIPDTLRTMPILTRMKVVRTRSNLLHQEVNKVKLDSSLLQLNINEMNNATTNLIAQINEKFKKDDIDFEQREGEANELKKQKKFLDSVKKVELEDQRKI